MKTAMQELIYDLKLLHEKDDVKVVDIEILINYAEGKLEKEKEQIIDAYSEGYGDGVQEPNPNDEYYDQTYK